MHARYINLYKVALVRVRDHGPAKLLTMHPSACRGWVESACGMPGYE